MLLPRFKIRTVLIIAAAIALVSVAGRDALTGEPWAIGVATAVLSLLLVFCLGAVMFGLATLLAGRQEEPAPATPSKRERIE